MIQQVIVIGIAAGYLTAAWRCGSIFSSVIQWLKDGELQRVGFVDRRPRLQWLSQKLTELLLCPFCLAPYVCFLLHIEGVLKNTPLETLISVFASSLISAFVAINLCKQIGGQDG